MWNLRIRNPYRFAARAALCLAVAAACSLPASADQWNKKTYLTFNEPVEIPGKVLPAGTYVFQLLNSNSDRDIVQIYNKDQNQLDATILAIPDYRVKTPDKTIVRFEERASNTPEALKAWFYPGDNYGLQFVYPHSQALRIAKETNQTVLATRDDSAGKLSAPAGSGNQSSVPGIDKSQVTAVTPSGEDVDINIVVQPAPKK